MRLYSTPLFVYWTHLNSGVAGTRTILPVFSAGNDGNDDNDEDENDV